MSFVLKIGPDTPIPEHYGNRASAGTDQKERIKALLDALRCPKVYVTEENAHQTFRDLFSFLEKTGGDLIPLALSKVLLNSYLNKPDSNETLTYLWADTSYIIQSMFIGKTPVKGDEKHVYLSTLGAPGAGKTTVFERFLNAATENCYRNIIVCDPDQPIRMMGNLYQRRFMSMANIADQGGSREASRRAYSYCLDGSGLIANLLLNMAFAGGYNIAHGSTSTGPLVPTILHEVKRQNMYAHYLVVAAPQSVRERNDAYRVETLGIHQSTPEDVKNKGKLFLARLPQILRKESGVNQVDLYFASRPQHDADYVARFQAIPTKPNSPYLQLTARGEEWGTEDGSDQNPTFLSFCREKIQNNELSPELNFFCDQISAARAASEITNAKVPSSNARGKTPANTVSYSGTAQRLVKTCPPAP